MAVKVDIKELVKDFIDKLNIQCVEQELNKNYDLKVVTRGKEKIATLYVSDLTTHARIKVTEKVWKVSNSGEFLRKDYTSILYREILYHFFVFSAINLEADASVDNFEDKIDESK